MYCKSLRYANHACSANHAERKSCTKCNSRRSQIIDELTAGLS